MQYVTDLHLHSKYSRAVSQSMVLPEMARVAQGKGIDILTVSDWTHPVWMKEISGQLVEAGEGIYRLKNHAANSEWQMANSGKETLFICTTEISSIFKQNNKLRRIHNLVFAPSLTTAEKITAELVKRGANVASDGRPIIGLSSKQLLEVVLSVDEQALLIPCHVWTPHFGMYGSASGFNSVVESFEELAPHIYGIETGLSSDPEMNWELSELEKRTILSFSDAHSPAKMGREATVMELEKPDFPSIRDAIMQPSRKSITSSTSTTGATGNVKKARDTRGTLDTHDASRIVYTIEFYPEEGKYHYTGHRDCKVSFSPEEASKKGGICPVCHKKMTEGVLYRVMQLAGENYSPKAVIRKNEQGLKWFTDPTRHHPPFVKLVPLLEVLAESMDSTVASLKVKEQYALLLKSLGSEIDILLKISIQEIAIRFGARLAEGIQKVRGGDIVIQPGYDNQYGVVRIWSGDEPIPGDSSQMSLL